MRWKGYRGLGRITRCALRTGVVLCALTACAGAPVPVEPDARVETPAEFTSVGEAAVVGRWWETFADGHLNAHIAQALRRNRDLESIRHAFRAACAAARGAAGARYPTVDLFVDGGASREDGGARDESGDIGGAVSFEVDLWGRLEATRRAAVFEAHARHADIQAARVSLTAEVARAWYRLVEAQLQVAVLDEQIEANQRIRELIEPRVVAQQLRAVDLMRQDALIEATREERIDAVAEGRLLRNQLAVLTGQAPGAISAPAVLRLVDLPALPRTGVPIDTVRRRPDVEAARRRVMAADQELGAALLDRYPQLSVDASLGSASGVFEGFIASFAAGALASLFDGGVRRAEIDRSWADRDRLLAQYGQAVLVALREVEDALVEETRQRERLASVERQLELTRASATRLRDDYLDGQGSYIDVLNAMTSEQDLRREVLSTRRLLIEARVGLHRALAGRGPTAAGKEGS